jgi:hypothetical protein
LEDGLNHYTCDYATHYKVKQTKLNLKPCLV